MAMRDSPSIGQLPHFTRIIAPEMLTFASYHKKAIKMAPGYPGQAHLQGPVLYLRSGH